MRSKLFAVLALLLIGSLTVQANVLRVNVTAASFLVPPEAVVDVSTAADNMFAKANASRIAFTPGKLNDTLYVWALSGGVPNASAISLVKRTLDSKTLKPSVPDMLIKTNISDFEFATGGLGYVGFATLAEAGAANNIFVSVLPDTAIATTAPVKVQITNNSDAAMTFKVLDLNFMDGVFYILYAKLNKKTQNFLRVYLQGVKAENATLLYSNPIEITKFKKRTLSPEVIMGFNTAVNPPNVVIAWKRNNNSAVMQAVVNSTGKVGTPISLTKDTKAARYRPLNVVSSSGSYGVIILKENLTSEDASPILMLYSNGNPKASKQLDIQVPKGHNLDTLQTIDRKNGFIVAFSEDLNDKEKALFRYFDSNGTALEPQKEIAAADVTTIIYQIIKDASAGVWVGFCEFESTTLMIDKCFLGKLLA